MMTPRRQASTRSPRLMRSRLRLVACSLVLSCVSGCALTGKAEPMAPRYFSPVSEHSQPAPETRGVRLELRPGQFESAAYLEERIAYRLSETELGYYDERRWTELPEQFMRRELLFELFERRGLRHIVTGRA